MFDPVAELGVGVKDLAGEDRTGWTPLALSDRVKDLVGLSEAMTVQVLRAIAAWDGLDAWAADGAVTAPAWLRAHAGLSRAEASSLVHLARLYRTHAAVARALDDGTIRVAHARHLRRAERNRETPFAAMVDGLVGDAADLSVEDFGHLVDAWIELIDDTEPDDPDRCRFRIADTLGGRSVAELVATTGDAAIIRAALDALDSPDPVGHPGGPRTREQRHYALVIDIFRRALQDQLGDDVTAPGGVDVIMDAATAAELTADPDTEPADLGFEDPIRDLGGAHTDHQAGLRALRNLRRRRCHHPDGTPARRAFAAALLCSGWIRLLVRDPHTGATLNYGRAQRRFSVYQRRALVIRDRGCVFPGCDRPPRWCDAHHLRPWDDDGPTDLDNGVLLCRRHHVLVHTKRWRLHRDPRTGVITATAPDGRTLTRHPTDRCPP